MIYEALTRCQSITHKNVISAVLSIILQPPQTVKHKNMNQGPIGGRPLLDNVGGAVIGDFQKCKAPTYV